MLACFLAFGGSSFLETLKMIRFNSYRYESNLFHLNRHFCFKFISTYEFSHFYPNKFSFMPSHNPTLLFHFAGVCLPQIPAHGNGIPQIRMHRSHHRPRGGGGRRSIRVQRVLERQVTNSRGRQLHGQHQDFGNGVRQFFHVFVIFFWGLTTLPPSRFLLGSQASSFCYCCCCFLFGLQLEINRRECIERNSRFGRK